MMTNLRNSLQNVQSVSYYAYAPPTSTWATFGALIFTFDTPG